MRRAAEISSGAHLRAMRATRPGRHEYEIEAELLSAFRKAAPRRRRIPPSSPAAPTPACCTTSSTAKPLADGDLLLIDAAAEFGRLCGRHHPHLSGERPLFSSAEAIYELVLAAQAAAIGEVRPGALERSRTTPRCAC
jgi:Xaa-Pro aminopeptidase